MRRPETLSPVMKTLLIRSFSSSFSLSTPLPCRRVSVLFLHSVAGDGTTPRKAESNPFPPRPVSSPYSFSSSSRKHFEDESKHVKVAVWWDFENCHIPLGVNVFRVVHRILSALRSSGIKGPITMTAFGDVSQLSRSSQEALTSTGVCLNHVPRGGKNSSDRFFREDIVFWILQNPPPVHFFLISGDKDFANMLHRLRMSNYNILLASPESAPGVLCSAATIMWTWPCLVKGENPAAKHFNYPPDGLYGSWYGHHRAVLDDPFSDIEIAANLQSQESMELITETRPRPIPKVLVSAVRKILHAYPEGITMSDLRSELKRINITVDKDFFGYKKFSHLLASMPSVLKFVPGSSLYGQPLVVSPHRKTVDSVASRCKSVHDNGANNGENSDTKKQDTIPLSSTPSNGLDPKSATPETPDIETKIDSDSTKKISHCNHSEVAENGGGLFDRIKRAIFRFQHLKEEASSNERNDMKANDSIPIPELSKSNVVERGFLQRFWRILNRPSAGQPTGGSGGTSQVDFLSNENSSEVNSICKPTDQSKLKNKATSIRIPDMQPSDSSDTKRGLFNWITSWWKDQGLISGPEKQVFGDQENDTPERSKSNIKNISHETKPLDAFSKGYFWDALESFLLTSKGADLILKSRTREQLVQELQKEGPWVLKDFTEAEVFELVNLMIVDKKWIEESTSLMFPFKLSFSRRKCVPSHVHSSNGLSSLFMDGTSKSNAHRQCEQESLDLKFGSTQSSYFTPPQNFMEMKAWFQNAYKDLEDVQPEDVQKMYESKFNTPLVSSVYGHSNLRSLVAACLTGDDYYHGKRKSSPSREKILSDCQTLLIELFNEYPDGFNISIFKPSFLQRHGYILDYQMLGYPKLASLLQIMPRVRIESSFVIPAERFYPDSSCSKPPLKNGDGNAFNKGNDDESNSEDSAWDELGPLSETVVDEDNNNVTHIKDGDESCDDESFSDEDFTDSEGDTPFQSEELEEKSKKTEEESSLIQILDSWYGSKEGGEKGQTKGGKNGGQQELAKDSQEGKKEQTQSTKQVGEKVHEAVDGLVDCSKDKADDLVDIKPEDKHKVKLRLSKRYSFVSESRDDKERLVDSIVGSLKKAGNSKLRG